MGGRAARPTIADVARVAGVSKGTVSFALNGREGVAAHTRDRVLAAAAQLCWVPDARARALSTARAFAVGLVIARPPELLRSDPFFAMFITGLETVLAVHESVLILQVVRESSEEDAYRRLAGAGRVDGVFLTDLRVDDPRPALLHGLGVPALAVGRQRNGPTLASVRLDDTAGIAAAVEHLIAQGHDRIGYVGGPLHWVHGADRRQSWRDALAAAGMHPGPERASDFSAAGGAKATVELLSARPRPTAIVYANDLMAMAGMAVLAAAGLRVPEDVSVTGFDDVELASHTSPPLTSVRTDVMAWGQRCAAVLLDVVAGNRPPPAELAPTRLVIRGSTAAKPH